ncbi:MAG: hypothetical protein AAGA62_01700, partial [Bacteroidota bacterium]
MKRIFTSLLWILLLGTLSLSAQSGVPRLDLHPKAINYTSSDLNESFKSYQVFRLDHRGLERLAAKSTNLNLNLRLSPEMSWDLQLEPFQLLAPDFRFKVLTEEGVEYQQAPTNAVFRGQAKSGGKVLMTVWKDYFVLSIRSQEEERFIEPLYKMVPGAAKNLYVSYRSSDVLIDPALKCGHTEAEHHHEELPHEHKHPHEELPQEHKHGAGNAKMMCDAVFAELALAAAFDMVQKFG